MRGNVFIEKPEPLTFRERMRALFLGERITHLASGETLQNDEMRGYWHGDNNPDEVLRDRGKSLEIYGRMMLDDKIAGIIRLKKSLILGADWEIKGEDEEAVEFCKGVLDNLRQVPFADVLDNMLDCWIYGFKLAEIVWKMVDGKWVIDAIKPKYSNRIMFHTDDFGNLEYAYIGSDTEANRIDLTREGKYILMVNPYVKDGNWYGESDLRSVYREWKAKDSLVKWRTVFMQNFAAPTIQIHYQQKLIAAQRTEVFQALKDWQEFGQIRIPCFRDKRTGELKPLIELKLLEPTRAGQAEYTSTIQELDKAIARKLLIADKLGFTEGATGSYALAQTQLQVVMQDISREHNRIADAFNTQLLKPLCEANGFEPTKLHFVGMAEGLTPSKVEMITMLKDKGLIHKLEPFVREFLGIPAIDDELKELWESEKPPALPPPPNAPSNPNDDDDDPKPNEKEIKQQFATPTPPVLTTPTNLKTPKGPNYLDRINYQKTEDRLDTIAEGATGALTVVQKAATEEMIAWLEGRGILEGKNVSDLDRLRIMPKQKKRLEATFQTLLGESYFTGRVSGAEQIKKHGKGLKLGIGKQLGWEEIDTSDYLDTKWLRDWLKEHDLSLTDADKALVDQAASYAFFLTGEMDRELVSIVKNTVYPQIGIASPSSIAWQIRENVKDFGRNRNITIVRTNSGRYWNNGNYQEFADAGPLVVGGQYSALMDLGTTAYCAAHHGKFLLKSHRMYGRVPPAHYNCRSTLAVVFAGEDYTDNFDDVPSDASTPQRGFGA